MMAMNDPSTAQGEWVQFYHRTPTGGAVVAPRAMSMFGQAPAVSEATVVTTTVASPSIPSPMPTGPGTAMGTHTHSPNEGPGGRPLRKRGRAARRAPTTVLNTDLNNFRALVQQYTGARTAPFSSLFRPDVRVANFGFDNHPALNAMIIRPQRTQFYHQQQLQHQQQHIQQVQQGEEGMFPMGQACDVLLSDSNNSISNMEVSEEFLKSMSSQNGHMGSGGYMF